MTNQPPRILTEPLAELLARELGLEYLLLPENNVPVQRNGVRRQSRVLSRRELRAITRKLVWAYIAQKSAAGVVPRRAGPLPAKMLLPQSQKKVAKAR
jgi:hypothetical protein